MVDKEFNPEPMPGKLTVYREKLWYKVQYIEFHMGEINLQVAKNKGDIGKIKTDVTVAKTLGRVSATLIILAGVVVGGLAALGVI